VSERGWRVVAARRTGEAHLRRGERGQDAFRATISGDALIAAVSDGAGSAPRGGAGAALACRAACAAARATLGDGVGVADIDDATALGWGMAAGNRLAEAADAAGAAPRDLAATLVLVVSDGAATLAVHVGEGAVALRGADGAWTALSWPEGGEYAGETRFLTDEAPAIRVSRADAPATGLALLTDGLERLVLDFAAGAPHAPFFDRMLAPLDKLPNAGRDAALSRALAAYLGGEGVAARTDDDRTLLLAALPEAAR
jgi:hypothetical protein